MRAPLAPPRMSDPRNVLALSQAVATNSETPRPLFKMLAFNSVTSASVNEWLALGTGSCQIRSSLGTSAPK